MNFVDLLAKSDNKCVSTPKNRRDCWTGMIRFIIEGMAMQKFGRRSDEEPIKLPDPEKQYWDYNVEKGQFTYIKRYPASGGADGIVQINIWPSSYKRNFLALLQDAFIF